MENYKIGDIIKARVVKLMPFGAFAEIIPGVDGLVHILRYLTTESESPAMSFLRVKRSNA